MARSPDRMIPASFVALGDSFTEGMHDELGGDGRHRGWADRVAAALATQRPDLRYANLAVRGRLLREVVDEQVPVTIALAPELVSFHAGGNDLLRPGAEIGRLLREYDTAVAALSGASDRVVLFTVLERLDRTGRVAERLARRFAAFNEGVREVARRHGAVLVDLGGHRSLQDHRFLHEDRLHLNSEGHRRVAAAVLEALDLGGEHLGGEAGWWREPLPPLSQSRSAALAADLRWARAHLAPWVWRRLRGVSSGDGIEPKRPTLTPLAEDG